MSICSSKLRIAVRYYVLSFKLLLYKAYLLKNL